MAAPRSAGILLHRQDGSKLAVLLVHPGGPFWRNKWAGWWQIPKGLIEPDEPAAQAARREFAEELGHCPSGALQPLATIRQAGGKWVEAFTLRGDFDAETIQSNQFELEWPPRSSKRQNFPEIDTARWFTLADAEQNILPSQAPLLTSLKTLLKQTD